MFGLIDTDPCAPIDDPLWTGPRVAYTAEDDGLTKDWCGNVFLNPPYGRVIGDWIDKAIAEVESGRADVVMALVPARPGTQWFQRLAPYPICFLNGRIDFVAGDPLSRRPNHRSPAFPSAIASIRRSHYAEHISRFADAFEGIGVVMVPWRRV